MSVAIRDIKGAKIKDLDLMQMKFPEQGVAWNSAIKKQGEVRIKINESKLHEIILLTYRRNGNSAGCLKAYEKSIISNLKDLIEREE